MSARFPLPYAFCRDQALLAEREGEELRLWVSEATRAGGIAEVQRLHPVQQVLRVPQEQLLERIGAAYAARDGSAAEVVSEAEADVDLSRLLQDLPAVEDLLETADDAPIIRMLNALFTQAARDGASDIHVEPFEASSVVRFRIDGALRDVVRPNKALHAAMISRVKILAQLDIAEKRLPQDGRISLRIGGRALDVRVSTLPCAHGERAVLRLLDKSAARLDLRAVGMAAPMLERFDALVRHPHGLLLVTGPTGSGKTTTLYSALSRLDASQMNIMTGEDPVEYDLPGIGQTQVNPRIELSFARALRAILRQDPDVVMIGEIRDFETAQIAIQASLTGHLVLATLHTNDSAAAVTRLIDMGVEPFLLASSLLGVLAQRLVRKLCPHCSRPAPDGRGCVADGCAECNQTGYRGRTGVFELLEADDALRAAVHERASEAELRRLATAAGLRSMREDGMRWVQSGQTSLAELLRVTRE